MHNVLQNGAFQPFEGCCLKTFVWRQAPEPHFSLTNLWNDYSANWPVLRASRGIQTETSKQLPPLPKTWGAGEARVPLHTELFPSLLSFERAFSGILDSLVLLEKSLRTRIYPCGRTYIYIEEELSLNIQEEPIFCRHLQKGSIHISIRSNFYILRGSKVIDITSYP